jgi:hypothetical protein
MVEVFVDEVLQQLIQQKKTFLIPPQPVLFLNSQRVSTLNDARVFLFLHYLKDKTLELS